jgi:hypothetical protein
VLAGSAAVTLTACDAETISLPGLPRPTPTPDPDTDLVVRARRLEAGLVAQLEVEAARPVLGPRLRPTLAVHRVHVELLEGSSAVTPSGPSGSSAPSASSSGPPPLAGPPPARAAALARAERTLQRRLGGLATESRSGPLARVFASMSAASAQQAVVLDRVAAELRTRGAS